MLQVDQVWRRISKGRHPLIPAKACLRDYKLITISKNFTLTTQQTSSGNSVDFPAGAVVLRMGAWASFAAQAASAARGDLSMIRISITYPASDGSLVTVNVNAAALLGLQGQVQWPRKEIIIPTNGNLSVTFVNLTTSTLDVDLAFDALVPKSAAA
jgi:hypothetical protein